MGCVPGETPLEKANFCFLSGYQLEIAFWLRMGARVHFPISAPGACLVGTGSGPMHAATFAVSSHVHPSYCIRKTLFPCIIHPLWLVQSVPSSTHHPEP